MPDDDHVLVAQWKQGDKDAGGKLVLRYQKLALWLAFSILWDEMDAQDAVQEAAYRATIGIDGFRGDSSFKTWFATIVTNVALNMRRSQANHPEAVSMSKPAGELGDEELGESIPGGPGAAELVAVSGITFERALRMLSDEELEVLVWRYVEGRSFASIAQYRGIEEVTARGQVAAAKAHLLRLMQ